MSDYSLLDQVLDIVKEDRLASRRGKTWTEERESLLRRLVKKNMRLIDIQQKYFPELEYCQVKNKIYRMRQSLVV